MLLDKINNLKNWQIALIILIVGFAVFWTGLTNPFQGDDLLQIVNNPVVHSVKNIKLFFEGGTFYNSGGSTKLIGAYFRPLMTTVFSLLYTLFGPRPVYFHLLQLMLGIGSAYILYLFFRYSFKPALALALSLIFLVHPLNSQVLFTIPCLQDSLYFFLGVLAIYLLAKTSTIRGLIPAILCLFLSLLSKEAGFIWIAISLLFLLWWDRKRLLPFLGFLTPPIALYFILRINAIGLLGPSPNNAPILRLHLLGRLMTAPSILEFYITKFIFPWKLATAYYWTYPSFSVRHFLVPLIVDLIVIGLFVYLGLKIHRKASKAMSYTYIFFGAWASLGILIFLQIIPLDMTAAESWFYLPMAGILGMLGVALTVFPLRIKASWVIAIVLIIFTLLSVRTFIRGFDYRSPYKLAYKNIVASSQDYIAYDNIASYLIIDGKYTQAKPYTEKSIAIYPTAANYTALGDILMSEGNYSAAKTAFSAGLKYGTISLLYEGLGKLAIFTGNAQSNLNFLSEALKEYPNDPDLWLDLALLEERCNNNAQAKSSIQEAELYGHVPALIYTDIMTNKPFYIYLDDGKKVII